MKLLKFEISSDDEIFFAFTVAGFFSNIFAQDKSISIDSLLTASGKVHPFARSNFHPVMTK